jgi:hypothetical protein
MENNYAQGVSNHLGVAVQNEAEQCLKWFGCSAVRAGQWIEMPPAEQERYTGQPCPE